MSAINERDHAISILSKHLSEISQLYVRCFKSSGKGALLVYADSVLENRIPNVHDYRTKEEMLSIFEDPKSQTELSEMINNYVPSKEGIMALITSHSNATFFITVKLNQ
ncbi:MAG: hypothetical protein HOC24_01935 [Deltaproteobacteria bacterium]|jgi:hypothetical protein|nr:hypothetical protein [Deltaproteobacteria bacterium]